MEFRLNRIFSGKVTENNKGFYIVFKWKYRLMEFLDCFTSNATKGLHSIERRRIDAKGKDSICNFLK